MEPVQLDDALEAELMAELNEELESLARAPLRDGPSPRGFLISLYEEHLEEASFLYNQRRSLLDDPTLPWPELAEFEERLEAHLDALVLGGELAFAVCRQQQDRGDAGEAHAALRVACRQRRWEAIDDFVGTTNPDDSDRWLALRDALVLEAPDEWVERIGALATSGGPAGTVAAATIGRRRLAAGSALLKTLEMAPPEESVELVGALGRLQHRPAIAALLARHLQAAPDAVRREAAIACLRMGEGSVVTYAQSQPGIWPIGVLALAGGSSAARRLLNGAPTPGAEGIIALGALGDVAAVPALLFHLGNPDLSEAASLALYLITGAELFEEAALLEESDEWEIEVDEPDEDEVELTIRESQGEPTEGTTIRRISQDPADWMAWWEAHAPEFDDGVRYRLGGPATPTTLVATIRTEHLPRTVRQLAADELAIRYACSVPFESDYLVRDQLAALGAMEAWAESGSFQPGTWYFAGRRM